MPNKKVCKECGKPLAKCTCEEVTSAGLDYFASATFQSQMMESVGGFDFSSSSDSSVDTSFDSSFSGGDSGGGGCDSSW